MTVIIGSVVCNTYPLLIMSRFVLAVRTHRFLRQFFEVELMRTRKACPQPEPIADDKKRQQENRNLSKAERSNGRHVETVPDANASS